MGGSHALPPTPGASITKGSGMPIVTMASSVTDDALQAVADRLGQDVPADGSPQAKQWRRWIGDAVAIINAAAARAGVDVSTLDRDVIVRVIGLAVSAVARHPDAAEQVDVQVDDARVSKRYTVSSTEVTIPDGWLAWLGLGVSATGAFSVRPSFQPDRAAE